MNHLIDPSTGQMIDPQATQNFLMRSLYHQKSQMLDRLQAQGRVKFANPAAVTRNQFGDVMIKSQIADSGGNFAAFFTEVFDPFINAPLWETEYAQNITVEQAPFGAEATSYLNQQVYGSTSKDVQGISWASSQQTDIPRVGMEVAKTLVSLAGWAKVADFDVFSIARAQMNGIPLESAMLAAVGTAWEADLNTVAHLGSYAYGGTGLLNTATTSVTPATKTAGGTRWIINGAFNATPLEILADVRAIENAAWKASGYNVVATDLLLDPVTYGALIAPLTSAGVAASISILEYLSRNSVCMAKNGVPLKIRSNKFLLGTTAAGEVGITQPFNASGSISGAGANSRAFCYSNKREYVRVKATNPFALQIQYQGTSYRIPYVGQLPQGVEFVYANTAAYADAV